MSLFFASSLLFHCAGSFLPSVKKWQSPDVSVLPPALHSLLLFHLTTLLDEVSMTTRGPNCDTRPGWKCHGGSDSKVPGHESVIKRAESSSTTSRCPKTIKIWRRDVLVLKFEDYCLTDRGRKSIRSF